MLDYLVGKTMWIESLHETLRTKSIVSFLINLIFIGVRASYQASTEKQALKYRLPKLPSILTNTGSRAGEGCMPVTDCETVSVMAIFIAETPPASLVA